MSTVAVATHPVNPFFAEKTVKSDEKYVIPEFRMRQTYTPACRSFNVDRTARAKIAGCLGIPDSEDVWTIVDSLGKNVHLISPNKKLLPKYATLKGIAIDISTSTYVIQSFPHTSFARAEELVPDNRGIISVKDNYGNVLELLAEGLRCQPAVEGAIVNIGLYDGKVLFATGSKFDAQSATRGRSLPLGAAYLQGGGPSFETLFDIAGGKKYGAYVYSFLVTGHGWTTATNMSYEDACVVLLGVFKNWDASSCPHQKEMCDFELRYSSKSAGVFKGMPGSLDEEGESPAIVYSLPEMSLAEANRFLLCGYSCAKPEDAKKHHPLLRQGEGVVLQDTRGVRVQVNSPAYSWRRAMRGEETSLNCEYFSRTDDAKLSQPEFDLRYPPFVAMDFDILACGIEDGHDLLEWPAEGKLMLPRVTEEERLYVIQSAFMISCPVNEQILTINLAEDFINARKKLVDDLARLKPADKVPKNIRELLTSTMNLSGGAKAKPAVYHEKLEYIIMKQTDGKEIYRLVKYFSDQEMANRPLTAEEENLELIERLESEYQERKATESGAAQSGKRGGKI